MSDQKNDKQQPSFSNRDAELDDHDYHETRNEIETTTQKLNDDTIYDNMIFPS